MGQEYHEPVSEEPTIQYGWDWSIVPFSQRGFSRAASFSFLTRTLLGLLFILVGLLFIVIPLASWYKITYYQGFLQLGHTYKHFEPIGQLLARWVIGVAIIFLRLANSPSFFTAVVGRTSA